MLIVRVSSLAMSPPMSANATMPDVEPAIPDSLVLLKLQQDNALVTQRLALPYLDFALMIER